MLLVSEWTRRRAAVGAVACAVMRAAVRAVACAAACAVVHAVVRAVVCAVVCVVVCAQHHNLPLPLHAQTTCGWPAGGT